MRTTVETTVLLGDLIAAAFDEAALHSGDPREVSRMAARTVNHVIRRSPRRVRTQKRASAHQGA